MLLLQLLDKLKVLFVIKRDLAIITIMKAFHFYFKLLLSVLFLVSIPMSCTDDAPDPEPVVENQLPPEEEEQDQDPEEEPETEPDPVPVPSPLLTFGSAYDSAAIAYEVIGDPKINGTVYSFNEVDSVNECGQPGGDYIKLDTLDAIWENGFSIAAWVEFQDQDRYFERIIDFGNGRGEHEGLNITFARLTRSNDLVLTSWVNSDSLTNRERGRLNARNAIKNGEFALYAATISTAGEMKIYINGEEVASKMDGQRVLNVQRVKNYIGHSNWCSEDTDFKGRIDGVYLYNEVVSQEQMKALYEYFVN